MKILKLVVTLASVAMLFGGCSKQVIKDTRYSEQNLTRPQLEPYQLITGI